MLSDTNLFGHTLRFWRRTLHLSQEALSLEIDISRKHLSFLETGKSSPSSALVKRIANSLDLHDRDTNNLLVSAGFAPTAFDGAGDDVDDVWRRKALIIMLKGLDPIPCTVRDRYGNIKAVNRGWLAYAYQWLGEFVFEAPLNHYQIFYHQRGWRQYITNWEDLGWSGILELQQQLLFSPNQQAQRIYDDMLAMPSVKKALNNRRQLDRAANAYNLKLQRSDSPVQTSTCITTTFTEDPIVEPRLILDTYYPRDFSFARTKDELQADQGLLHPSLYY